MRGCFNLSTHHAWILSLFKSHIKFFTFNGIFAFHIILNVSCSIPGWSKCQYSDFNKYAPFGSRIHLTVSSSSVNCTLSSICIISSHSILFLGPKFHLNVNCQHSSMYNCATVSSCCSHILYMLLNKIFSGQSAIHTSFHSLTFLPFPRIYFVPCRKSSLISWSPFQNSFRTCQMTDITTTCANLFSSSLCSPPYV